MSNSYLGPIRIIRIRYTQYVYDTGTLYGVGKDLIKQFGPNGYAPARMYDCRGVTTAGHFPRGYLRRRDPRK